MSTTYNIDLHSQETLNIFISVGLEASQENPMPEPINLDQSIFYFTVKRQNDIAPHNRNAIIKKEWTNQDVIKQISELPVGTTILNVTSKETNIPAGVYKYDIRMRDEYDKVSTICDGKFIVKQNTTNL